MSVANDFKSGYVAIIGPPNVGKSTFLNRVLGQKIAIVSSRPQTTRTRLLGIHTEPGYQLVFIDTPGIHRPKSTLGQTMVQTALDSLREADVVLLILDAKNPSPENAMQLLLDELRSTSSPAILVLNKVDLVRKDTLLPLIEKYKKLYDFKAIVPVSALTGENLDRLLNEILNYTPQGEPYFPPETITDQQERFLAAEMVREKVFEFTGQEIPYATAIIIDEFKELPEKHLVSISATILVEKTSQKGIMIGKGGNLLKRIGEAARKDLEIMLDSKVFLRLWVKVRKDWSNSPEIRKEMGF
ncbi:MAG: GTPase Era [Pseudomonadota bacterium]